MVDLDQCTHATINGSDKERWGWYPLPSSLSSSICLPSCPPRCPLPNCFSLMIAHLHLHWHPPDHRLSWSPGPADDKGAWCAVCRLHPPPSTCSMGELWALPIWLIMRSRFISSLTIATSFSLSLMPIVAVNLTISAFPGRTSARVAPLMMQPQSFSFPRRDSWVKYIWVLLRSELDPKGRWGDWGDPKWVKGRNTGEKVEQRSDWVNLRCMEVGQGCTLLNKFKHHKQRPFPQNDREIWFWV